MQKIENFTMEVYFRVKSTIHKKGRQFHVEDRKVREKWKHVKSRKIQIYLTNLKSG